MSNSVIGGSVLVRFLTGNIRHMASVVTTTAVVQAFVSKFKDLSGLCFPSFSNSNEEYSFVYICIIYVILGAVA